MTTPPGLSPERFKAALRRLRETVGADAVFTSPDDLATYKDAYSPFWGEPEERHASAAVAPATVEEVQRVVRIANEFKLPIYPISTGKNLGYGGSAPNHSGSVVVDLKRMNRILDVDATRHTALVEPGVSYFDLYKHIQERKLPLWIDCPEPGWGSLIGNALDHGAGYTATGFRDHFGAHCGMEVVLPNGDMVRTGMGAMPGANTWQDYRYGFGPYLDGIFSQSNYGIVTKMGFWLYPQPEGLMAGVVEAPRYRDIIPLIEVLNRLENSGICDGMPQITSPVFGGIIEPPNPAMTAVLGRSGGASDADLASLARGRAYWHLRVLAYGPPDVAKAKWEYAKSQFRKAIPDCRFPEEVSYRIPLQPQEEEALSAVRLDLERKVNFGIPNLGIFAIGARSPVFPAPTDGHIWFSPIIPRSGEGVIKAQNVFARALTEMKAWVGGNAPLPAALYPRTFLMIFPVFLSRSDVAANRKSRELLRRLIEVAAAEGWGEYRAAPALQDYIRGFYNYNGNSLLRLSELIKDSLDPNGILAAGRYGIWPKHLRDAGKNRRSA